MTVVNKPDLIEVAKQLRKDGRDAGALLVELGVMQLIFDFRKRARAENIDSTDQIDALCKMFASLIMPYAYGIMPLKRRIAVVDNILSLAQGHLLAAAAMTLEDNQNG